MLRRVFSIGLVLGLLMFAFAVLMAKPTKAVQAQAATASFTALTPCHPIIVVTASMTPTMTSTPTRTATATATACGPIYITATPGVTPTFTASPTATATCAAPSYYATVTSSAASVNTGDQITVTVRTNVGIGRFSLSIIDNATGALQSQTDPIFAPARPVPQIPPGGVYTAQWTLTAVRSGIVTFQGVVNGEVQACLGGPQPIFTLGSASGQSGNVTVSGVPITLTPMSTLTPTPTVTATSTTTKTSTRTRTPTRTLTGPPPTRTRTPTPTLGSGTNTLTPTATPTCPCLPPPCSTTPVIVAAPFAFDGAGTFCWQSSNLGSYINSWNTTSLTVNSVNYTNVYAAAGSLPAKINGYWYVNYTSAVSYGHFEAK